MFVTKETVVTALTGGGTMNGGLVITNLASQLAWSSDYSQSSTVGIQDGLSSGYWYSGGGNIQLIAFSIISVMFKIHCPGAITMMQMIRARFGAFAHLTFCVYGLLANIIVIGILMLGGCQNIVNLSQGISFELCAMLIVIVIGVYVSTSGVSSNYYISYLTTNALLIAATIFSFTFFFGTGDPDRTPFVGNISMIYQLVTCRKISSVKTNLNGSYLTFQSSESLKLAAINVIGICSTVFLDQSYWAASVVAKPKEGLVGFIGAGFVWFATPFTIANTFSLFYLSYGSLYGKDLLSPIQIDQGLAPEVVASQLLGQTGQIILTLMMMAAISTTASAEVFAVTSIVIYDIFAIYIKVLVFIRLAIIFS
ncbi:hypothetical protein Ciccas_001030 [Cichlidogyrus casuarinus]|uniref:Uncharacterized protein n=1 Tax=Cichlidogyrus casuarinus TaxID=1844966 RepID=A0ABD2QL76_9PLAT